MAEVFETDEHAYRACILYEVKHSRSVETAFKRMKKVKPNVEYSDFAYWYHRFSNGHHNLHHDRSTDPKPLGLSDMPTHVMERIVENLGLVDKLSTRKVCKSLRTVIDNQTSKFGRVDLAICEKYCEIHYENLKIIYFAKENGNYLLKTPRKSILLKGDYSLVAIREFASVITHPKWIFKQVVISANCDQKNEHKSVLFLNSLLSNHKFHVEKLRIDGRTFEPLATLLPLFEADRLYPRLISPLDDTQENLFEVIVEMNQWKNAARICIERVSNEFPIEVLFCARGEIEVYDFKLTESRLVKIRDILFKAPAFERFKFCDRKYDNREELSVLTDRVMGAHSAYDPHTKIYRIEDSKDYIQIFIEGVKKNALRIQRIRS
ncbi:hypothetical protein CAEBREN_18272 [Caenorhabditis brenneri]|uniref:F-box domain-containing protein n=1 Tax=Caenorhabditis brenneri TaxID=135651 RepID=G0NGG5_CAEBE|nr:hypothetical protein CAEBREN_18272 [Caenorhabditis brenneri]